MGRHLRELPRFKGEANGLIIRYFGKLRDDNITEFVAQISKPGPTEWMLVELKELSLPLLIMEAIEWTYEYKYVRNENNDGISRYSERPLSELRRDSTPLDDILRRRVDYKRNSRQYR